MPPRRRWWPAPGKGWLPFRSGFQVAAGRTAGAPERGAGVLPSSCGAPVPPEVISGRWNGSTGRGSGALLQSCNSSRQRRFHQPPASKSLKFASRKPPRQGPDPWKTLAHVAGRPRCSPPACFPQHGPARRLGPMRKVILALQMSLDGYMEGPGRDISWHMVDEELHSHFNQQLRANWTARSRSPSRKHGRSATAWCCCAIPAGQKPARGCRSAQPDTGRRGGDGRRQVCSFSQCLRGELSDSRMGGTRPLAQEWGTARPHPKTGQKCRSRAVCRLCGMVASGSRGRGRVR